MRIPYLLPALVLTVVPAGPGSAADDASFTRQDDEASVGAEPPATFGYGGSATGGGSASPVTVTTASAFASAVSGSTPKVVQVSGTLVLTGSVSVGSNTTVVGLGTNAAITGGQLTLSGVTNVIIRNLTLSSTGDFDSIRIVNGTTRVWVDHCTFDGVGDGAVDVTHASDNVTVSWCRFIHTAKTSLVGADDAATSDAGKLHVTYHHNWFGEGATERMPSVRYGRVHVFNNYYSHVSTLGSINFRVGSEVRIENNYFDGVDKPWISTQTDPLPAGFEQGKSYRAGNLLPNCTNVRDYYTNHTNLFTPSYAYTLDSAESVKPSVTAGAGAGKASQLWLEAEDAAIQAPFAIASDTGASKDGYIASSQSSISAAPTGGHVTYTNTLTGTAAVWLRIYCPSTSTDSFWVRYGSGTFANFFNTTGQYGSWIWVKWGEVPSGGPLTIAYREATTRLDRVLFTNDLSFTPAGEGP